MTAALTELPRSGLTMPNSSPDADLRRAAVALEAHFLAEMLKSAGLHETSQGFGGGSGEDQFASLLRGAQAEAMAEAGGIGLAEAFFRAMVADERR